MDSLDNPALRKQIDDFIREAGENALTWVEIHGLLCAAAVGPQLPDQWQQVCHAGDAPIPPAVAAALASLRDRVAATLGAGERIQLPCRLDPYADDEGNDLASWCAGFMAGVFMQEEAWYEIDEEQMANLLLPFVLIAGLDEDPDLDALWQDSKLVRQMALGLPELLEELFLHFHAPEAPDERDDA